ncbi:alpha-amylase family glycosyl hydrolase [Rubritalea marina]|uniref:alpha amylase C-terminal domain-containing protein n=1 Tax=Rubritalea marina TaxID=361055 RepID=UPI00035E2D3C|nr:alpha amylase C-terminal domain-containing protein [Rubritalea marina]
MNHQETPILVQNDIWLKDQSGAIQHRIDRFHHKLAEIESQFGSLRNFADTQLRLGVHYDAKADSWELCEWAPNAKALAIVGEFNDWDGEANPMVQDANGHWTATVPGASLKHGDLIKLRILGADNSLRDRIPATITRALQDPKTHDFSGQIWNPSENYQWKHHFDPQSIEAPIVYEAHTGMAGEEARLHSYREFAENIIPRVKKLGYNTIQLMAVQEHPYYGSFGYHVSNFFAACSRFGTPEDLKFLVDTAHAHGIAVIMDIVHSHAVKNLAEGLNEFDGTDHQYFHGGSKGDHPQWDSKCFDYGKEEVQRFLLSNVRYWLEEFQFDGFRFDGVTSMLYDHHGNIAFDHYDKYFSNGVDHDCVLYLQLATTLAESIKPGVLNIAEDMSGMPGLCRPIHEGGIGFSHRLAMGLPDYWIKLLKHKRDDDWNVEEIWETLTNRRHMEANIAYAESHDQALVGDKTLAFWLMDKEMYWHMALDDPHPVIDRGIAMHKLIRLLTSMIGGEGYLTFMGNEFGHPEWLDFPREGNNWSYHYCRRQWSLVDHPELKYKLLNAFDAAMIHSLEQHKILSAPQAKQLCAHPGDHVLAFERANVITAVNIHPTQSYTDYHIHVPHGGRYKVILNSDDPSFGGHDRIQSGMELDTVDGAFGPALSLYLPCRSGYSLIQVG